MKIWTGGAIRKSFEIKATDATVTDNGTLSGAAAVMGNIDSQGDVIFPGAFTACLAAFQRGGFVAVGHDWDDLPVAMPTLAEERGRILYTEAKFHSTSAGQDARTVCSERLAGGLSVGLSVGFFCGKDSCMWFESGQQLLDFAMNNGYDLSLFDTATIAAEDDFLRAVLRVEDLVEYSIVTKPANPMAQAMGAKSGEGIGTIRDLEAHLRSSGLSRTEAKRAISLLSESLRDAATDTDTNDGETPADVPGTSPSAATALALRALSLRHFRLAAPHAMESKP
jgi:phage head maturation protease